MPPPPPLPQPEEPPPPRAEAGFLDLAVARDGGEDLAGIDVDDAGGNLHDGLVLIDTDVADAAFAVPGASATARADVFVVVAEGGDVPDDDVIHAEQTADLGGSSRVGTITVGEVLLLQDLVERRTVDEAELTAVQKLGDEQVGDSFADVLVRTEDSGDAGLDRSVAEVHDRDLGLLGRCRQCGEGDSEREHGELLEHGGYLLRWVRRCRH